MLVVCLFSTLVFCQKVLFVLYKLTKRVMIWSLMRFYYPFLRKKNSRGFVQIRKRGTKSHSRVHLVPTFKKKTLVFERDRHFCISQRGNNSRLQDCLVPLLTRNSILLYFATHLYLDIHV